jgi:hypothetical protein
VIQRSSLLTDPDPPVWTVRQCNTRAVYLARPDSIYRRFVRNAVTDSEDTISSQPSLFHTGLDESAGQ